MTNAMEICNRVQLTHCKFNLSMLFFLVHSSDLLNRATSKLLLVSIMESRCREKTYAYIVFSNIFIMFFNRVRKLDKMADTLFN